MKDLSKYKCLFIGNFALGKEAKNGQTIRTRITYDHLQSKNLFKHISLVDTDQVHGHKIKLIMKSLWGVITNKYIIVSLSSRGRKVYFPLLALMSKVFSRRVYHFVTGGSLPDSLKESDVMVRHLNAFEYNFVQVESMKKRFEAIGVNNSLVIPNFKLLNISEKPVKSSMNPPFKLCTLSRIRKEKGIEDAIEAVKIINENYGQIICTLDIFGLPDDDYKETFDEIIETMPEYVKFRGLLAFDKTSETLKDYYALLFPTYHHGEGFPGTVIDAYASGLPIVASDWRFNREVINDGETGLIYETRNQAAFIACIEEMITSQDLVWQMKKNCLTQAYKYLPDSSLKEFYHMLMR